MLLFCQFGSTLVSNLQDYSEYNIHSLVKFTFKAQALGNVVSVPNQSSLTCESSLSAAKDAPHNHLILGYFNLRISAAHKLIFIMVD